jgi:hypothetical protein
MRSDAELNYASRQCAQLRVTTMCIFPTTSRRRAVSAMGAGPGAMSVTVPQRRTGGAAPRIAGCGRCPGLSRTDLEAAWAHATANPDEIREAIRRQDEDDPE